MPATQRDKRRMLAGSRDSPNGAGSVGQGAPGDIVGIRRSRDDFARECLVRRRSRWCLLRTFRRTSDGPESVAPSFPRGCGELSLQAPDQSRRPAASSSAKGMRCNSSKALACRHRSRCRQHVCPTNHSSGGRSCQATSLQKACRSNHHADYTRPWRLNKNLLTSSNGCLQHAGQSSSWNIRAVLALSRRIMPTEGGMAAENTSRRNLRAKAGMAKKSRGKQGTRMKLVLEILEKENRAGRLEAGELLRGIQSLAQRALDVQCRLQTPYSPMRLILGADGLRYWCSHKPIPHSEKA